MNSTSSTPKSPLESLPDKIKALILEFVSLKDYGKVAVASQDFNALLTDQSTLWAKYVCDDFMSGTSSEAPATFKEQFPANKELKEGQISHSSMMRAKEQIISHYQTQGRFKTFLEQYFDAKTTETFLNDMMKLFNDPPFPSPVYKKEAQSFPTNTVFQNFLTEIHFGIQGKTLFQSSRQKVVVDLVKKIEEQLTKRDVDTKELARLRWYLYDEDKEKDEDEEEEEKVSKAKEGLLSKRLAREKTLEHLAFQPNYKEEPQGAVSTASNTYMITALEELYYIIYAWIENYCAMICDYLTALKNPYLLLSEYARLWNKFALITIELNQIYQPYAELFSRLYEDKCSHLPNFPEFSMWRLAIKIWMDEVQEAFGYYLNESFRYILKKTRGEEKLIEYNLKNTTDGKGDSNDVPEEDSGFKDQYNLNKEKLKRILKGYYDAMDDLSHNEFSIFYWDCDTEAKTEPKVSLDTLILQDSQNYYEECRKVMKYNQNYFKKLLKNDYELVGNIFGELFNLEIKKLQTSTIKELLYKEFTAAIIEVENGSKASKTSDKVKVSTAPNNHNKVNLEQVLKLLKAEGVEDNNYFTPEKREKVAAVLSRDHESFNAYLFHLMEEQKDVDDYNKDMEEKKYFRYIRGFTMTDPRFKSFFELGRVPSFVEVHQPGLQRLNTREELEDKGDRFQFL